MVDGRPGWMCVCMPSHCVSIKSAIRWTHKQHCEAEHMT